MKSFKDFIVNESTFDTRMRNLLIQSNGFTKKIFISKLDALDNALKDNKLFDVIDNFGDIINYIDDLNRTFNRIYPNSKKMIKERIF